MSKQEENGDRAFTTVYFDSTAKAVINFIKYGLEKSFQEVSHRLDN